MVKCGSHNASNGGKGGTQSDRTERIEVLLVISAGDITTYGMVLTRGGGAHFEGGGGGGGEILGRHVLDLRAFVVYSTYYWNGP